MDLNLPSNVKVEEERDVVGGRTLPTGVYKGMIELVYLDAAPSGAKNVNIHMKVDNRVIQQTIYISNKAGKFTYGEGENARPLPGYSQVDSFLKALTGKGISEQTIEEKTIKIYNYDKKKEVPSKREVFTDTINQPIAAGILHVKEERTTKESGYKDGTGEYREYNEFNKWFDAETGLTNLEKKAEATEPAYLATWKKNNTDIVIRHAENTGAAKSSGEGTSGAPVASKTTAEPLFADE